MQKAGIPAIAGCFEHTSVIWHQVQAAKTEKRVLHVIFLDLSLIWSVCDYFRVPGLVVNIVKVYFQDIRLCLSTAGFTTGWLRLEIAIMAECSVSQVVFTMGIEVIITTSKWLVGGLLQGRYTWPHIQVLKS